MGNCSKERKRFEFEEWRRRGGGKARSKRLTNWLHCSALKGGALIRNKVKDDKSFPQLVILSFDMLLSLFRGPSVSTELRLAVDFLLTLERVCLFRDTLIIRQVYFNTRLL